MSKKRLYINDMMRMHQAIRIPAMVNARSLTNMQIKITFLDGSQDSFRKQWKLETFKPDGEGRVVEVSVGTL